MRYHKEKQMYFEKKTGEEIMNKWEVFRYLLDAKKAVDTMLYLSEHIESVSMLDVRQKVRETRRKFYVNGCIVLDKCFPKSKKQICENPVINAIYYERDKDSAHKDEDYIRKEYSSLAEMTEDMKIQIIEIRKVCKDFLPEVLTLDFFIYDSELFRIANGVTKEMEMEIWNAKFPFRNSEDDGENGEIYNIFLDTEDIRYISDEEKNRYATIIKCGICMEETLQNLQDWCIRTNVLYKENMWVSVKQENYNRFLRLRELGFLDKFDLPRVPKNKREERKFIKILKEEGVI